MSADLDLYQQLVLEHKRSPRCFGTLPAPTHEARGRNPQCGDDVRVQLQVEGDTLRDIRFDGRGCAICIASASMMSEAVRGHAVADARALQQRFRAVLTGQAEPDEANLGKLVSLAAVRRYPGRIKCALLGWHALMHALAGAADEDPDIVVDHGRGGTPDGAPR
ncbi:Fe-S cluster assembly sulfur transfer protein SufU [Azohydromonas sp.]|uniref:Fe-S cluster assembly sulfur transfer protein SufU n=1 Tax=Azohydromonas sp. TaxID=1872666 RepID=UPI002CA4A985|nr:SUF system NifU family Fe-S cluster assembly protein [Azohydromonas sp.]HMM86825.1 SUF system NifU family Fe-S cluster assembly protein [Azohydromonas sp.]